MNHLNLMLRSSRGAENESQVRYLRLADPLGGTLSAFDLHNERINLFDARAESFIGSEAADEVMDELKDGGMFSKLIVYSLDPPASADGAWTEAGFRREGVIRAFYADDADAAIWASYSNEERGAEASLDQHEAVLAEAREHVAAGDDANPAAEPLPEGFRARVAIAEDAGRLVGLLADVLGHPETEEAEEHLSRQIATHRTLFRIIEDADGKLVAAASADLDIGRRTAEIAESATPTSMKVGIAASLVRALQNDLATRYRIRSVYSLAPAGDARMNGVFSALGYEYTGRLVNHARSGEGWQSTNLWCRSLVD